MPTGAATRQPFGHYAFCRREPDNCRPQSGALQLPPALDLPLMSLASHVNRAVNTEIRAASDQSIYGVEERWTIPANGYGDCEDYALLKRQRLHAAGVALSNLLLTVVRKRDGTGHAVLTLRTAAGDLVLDNLDDRVRPWFLSPYRFIKRQSTVAPARWVEIERGDAPLVSAMTR